MSVGAMWKEAVARRLRPQTLTEPVDSSRITSVAHEPLDPLLTSLIRQLFCSSSVPERTRIFFAAAGNETNISGLCDRVGRALAEMSGETVGVIGGGSAYVTPESQTKKPNRGSRSVEFWRASARQLAEKLWHVPTGLFQAEFDSRAGVGRSDLPFDYVICGSAVSDSAAPLFSKACDGAVLVLSANRTRRESALRAKEVLRSWNMELLGAVLDNRTLPVPESIYRLL